MRDPAVSPHWQCLVLTITPVVLALGLVAAFPPRPRPLPPTERSAASAPCPSETDRPPAVVRLAP